MQHAVIGWLASACSALDLTALRVFVSLAETGFPLRLKNLGKWEGIFQSGKSQGILNRLEKSGKITQNTGKLREFEINII